MKISCFFYLNSMDDLNNFVFGNLNLRSGPVFNPKYNLLFFQFLKISFKIFVLSYVFSQHEQLLSLQLLEQLVPHYLEQIASIVSIRHSIESTKTNSLQSEKQNFFVVKLTSRHSVSSKRLANAFKQCT